MAYGRESRQDQRYLLDLKTTGRARLARESTASAGQWIDLQNWSVAGRRLVLRDPRDGRELTADLRRASLGGTWTSASDAGGWWCARRLDATAAEALSARSSAARLFLPPALPDVMATPSYPRQAIWEAKEGHAVVCFVVEPGGAIRNPELVELSDAAFRDATLNAIARSRYRAWDGDVARPACRSFVYELEPIVGGT